MALIHSLESDGGRLFRYRGQIPVILFLVALPVIYFTDYSVLNNLWFNVIRSVAIFATVAGFVFRAWAIGTTPKGTSGRNRDEQVAESLNTKGVYSMVRHPLYVGNYFMWLGIVIYVINPWFVVLFTLAFWLYYERIMFAEERFLERTFGDTYTDWSLKVPAFIPRFSAFVKGGVPFSLKSILRREYSGFLATVFGFLFVDVVRDYFVSGKLALNYNYAIVLGVALFITLLLRTLKHHTQVLADTDPK